LISYFIINFLLYFPQDQLSLAIGKDGQNVRLAAKLTGWKLDIKKEGEEQVEEDELDIDEDEQVTEEVEEKEEQLNEEESKEDKK